MRLMDIVEKLIGKQPLFCIVIPFLFYVCQWDLVSDFRVIPHHFLLPFDKIVFSFILFEIFTIFYCFSRDALGFFFKQYPECNGCFICLHGGLGRGEERRASILLSFSAAYAKHPGTKPTLLSFLLNRSSTSSKKAPSSPKEGLRRMADNHTKWHYRGATLCYQLFGSKLFNNVKGGSTA